MEGAEGAVKDSRILVVDDNEQFCVGLEQALHAQGYRHVQTASDGWKALEWVEKERPDLVLLDIYLPGMDGLHLLTAIHKIDPSVPIVMLTSEADEECIRAAASLGSADYLVKPLKLSTLFSRMETCLNGSPPPQSA